MNKKEPRETNKQTEREKEERERERERGSFVEFEGGRGKEAGSEATNANNETPLHRCSLYVYVAITNTGTRSRSPESIVAGCHRLLLV